MVISKAPYFNGCKNNPWNFVDWINGMEQFFEQANFANGIKVRYAKLKLTGRAQMFSEDLEYFHYINYEPAISSWEDMKEKFCQEYLSPYFKLSIYPNLSVVIFKLKQIR